MKEIGKVADHFYENPRDRERLKELLESEGVVRNYEMHPRHRAGHTIIARMNAYIVRGEAGCTLYYQGEMEDITEQKQAREDADRLASFPRLNPAIVTELNLAREVTYCNPACLKVFPGISAEGLKHPFLQDSGTSMILSPDFPDVLLRTVRVGDDWYEQAIHFIAEYQSVRVYARNVTERKKAEEALRNAEARYRSYFELPLIGIAITSPEKSWLEANDRLLAILGYTWQELKKTTWSDLTYPEDIAADVEQFNRVLAGKIEGYMLENVFYEKTARLYGPAWRSAACATSLARWTILWPCWMT